MMRQEINLYKKIQSTKIETVGISWKQYWISNLIVASLFSFMNLFFNWETHRVIAASDTLTIAIQNAANEFEHLKSKYPAILFAGNVNNVLKDLTDASVTQKQLLETITRRRLFSENLRAFALSIVPDVWLTSFMIGEGGKEVSLKGQSLTNESLENFFVNLLHQSLFNDYSLSIQNIKKSNADATNKKLTFDITLSKRPA